METGSFPYLLIFRDSTPDRYEAMSPEQRRECLEQWNAWGGGLMERGIMQHGHPLELAGRVVSGARGKHVVDGPFAEAKELIGGYFLLNVAGLEEATAIAQRCPLLPYGMTVEVRPVADACHLARSLGWQTMHEPANV